MKEKIFIFGASGHAKVVIDVVERQGVYTIAFLVDDNADLRGKEFFGYPVLGGKAELLLVPDAPLRCLVAIGVNSARVRVAEWLGQQGYSMVTAIHPSAQIGRDVTIGEGSVIMAGVVVNPATTIGEQVIVNTMASIDHDCRIDSGVHLAPGSTLCGSVTVGTGSFICSGATVIPNLKVGSFVTVGAGSTVIRDVPDGAIVLGSPAKCKS